MKKLISFIAIAIGLISCDLNRLPEDAISPETFFKTENDLLLYTNSFYNALPSAEDVYNEDVDNIAKNSLRDELQGTRVVPTSGGGWSWGTLRNINYFLANSGKCPDKRAVAKYNGLAKFFRAYFYFGMVKRFGDVPWYGGTIDVSDNDLLTKARDPRAMVMDSVMADLNNAISVLDASRQVNTITKWTALALKSRVGLYEGTFRKYHPEFSLPNADKFLDASIEASENLMKNSGYTIYKATPATAYMRLFSSDNAIPDEVILARDFSDELQVYHSNLNYYTMTASYGKPGLEKKLVNSYLMADGTRFTDIKGYETMQFAEEVQNRDPRLSQTIRTPGYTRIGETTPLVPEFGATVTGYQLIKFVSAPKWDTFTKDITDMPIFRYAEVLMNYAEAKAERGTLTQADLDISTKLTRDRVGMPNINMAAANANPDPYQAQQYAVEWQQQRVILEIRRERRIELVMENFFRWDDLIRWKEGQLLTKVFKGMYFPGPGSYDLDKNGKVDLVIYEGTKPTVAGAQVLKLGSEILLENGNKGGNIVVNGHINKKFNESRDYLYPIPTQELLLNTNLKQNPNW